MITTLQPILALLSTKLKETSAITTADRIACAVAGVNMLLLEAKFPFARKKHSLTITTETEYDLTAEISDFDPVWGIYMIEANGEEMSPCDYSQRANYSDRYYLLPDEKSVGFTSDLSSTTIDIWYYRGLSIPADASTTLNLPLPEMIKEASTLAAKYMVHEGKRQRNDARNALIDYQAEKEKIVQAAASNRGRNNPKIIPRVLAYSRVSRQYEI